MKWVVELLYPTLLQWNQWAWRLRRYNVGADAPHGGLLVLGADNGHLPCEGGTVTSPAHCSGKAFGALAAVLESGMDNSPMYDNTFDQQPATYNATTVRKKAVLLRFLLCLSRACLDKLIVFIRKVHMKGKRLCTGPSRAL